MDAPITDFHGENFFLSNFYPCRFRWLNHWWDHSEAAYQWSKNPTEMFYEEIAACKTPGETKRLAKTLDIKKTRPGFHDFKVNVMTSILLEKFLQNPELLAKLLATGERELIEGNWWNDTFWGVCNGVGENQLGKVLMFVRDYYRDKEVPKLA